MAREDTVDVAAVHVSAAAEGGHLLPAASHVNLVALVGQTVQGGERPLHLSLIHISSGAQPSNIQLTAEETDAVYALLDTLQYKRLGTASAMQDCYARLDVYKRQGEGRSILAQDKERCP